VLLGFCISLPNENTGYIRYNNEKYPQAIENLWVALYPNTKETA